MQIECCSATDRSVLIRPFAAILSRFQHCVAVFFWQGVKNYTDVKLVLLYRLKSGTYLIFVQKDNFLSTSVCCPDTSKCIPRIVCVLLCFIKPILGNRYVRSRGFIVSKPRETHPRSEIADVPTSPCPPLNKMGCPDPHPPPSLRRWLHRSPPVLLRT